MKTRNGLLALMILGLVTALAGSALAVGIAYDDNVNGNWNVAGTWTSAGGTYPQNIDDTALIDNRKVTVPRDPYVFPSIATITIGGTGNLFFDGTNGPWTVQTVSADIVFTGGGTLEKSRYAKVTVDGDISVTGGTSTIIAGTDRSMSLNGTITGAAGVKLIKMGHPIYGGSLLLGADNSATYAGNWDVLQGNLYANVNGALGTGHIVLDGTNIHDPLYPSSLRFDYMPSAGSLSGVGPADITVKAYSTIYFNQDGDNAGSGAGTNTTMDVNWSNDPLTYLDGGSITSYHGTQVNGIVWHDPIQVVSTGTIAPGYRDFRMLGVLSGGAGTKLTVGSWASLTTFEAPINNFLGEIVVVVDGTLQLDLPTSTNWTLPNNISGAGKIKVEDGTSAYTLTSSGGTVSPGLSVGALTIAGSFAMTNSATLEEEIMSSASRDVLNVNGTVNLAGGRLNILVDPTVNPLTLAGSYVSILNNDNATPLDPITGHFMNDVGGKIPFQWNNGVALVNYLADITYAGVFGTTTITGGNDIILYNFALAPMGTVPEPAALGLVGLTLLAIRRRRS